VKATIGICTLADYFVAKKCNNGNSGELLLGFQILINEIPIGGGSFYRGFDPNNS
jgi:hypothetical protein